MEIDNSTEEATEIKQRFYAAFYGNDFFRPEKSFDPSSTFYTYEDNAEQIKVLLTFSEFTQDKDLDDLVADNDLGELWIGKAYLKDYRGGQIQHRETFRNLWTSAHETVSNSLLRPAESEDYVESEVLVGRSDIVLPKNYKEHIEDIENLPKELGEFLEEAQEQISRRVDEFGETGKYVT